METIHIGNKIRSFLHKNPNKTVKGLAEWLDKHEQTVYDIFKRADIHSDQLRQIAEYLEVPMAVFFDDNAGFDPHKVSRTAVLQQNSNLATNSTLVNTATAYSSPTYADPPPPRTIVHEAPARITEVPPARHNENRAESPATQYMPESQTTTPQQDYRKRYEEALREIQLLKSRLKDKQLIIKLLLEKNR